MGERVEPAAGEDLAVVGENLCWAAVAGQGGGEDPADGAGVGPFDQPDHDAEPEWSLIPVTALGSRPSVSQMPPMMSSCHSSIGRSRSQRR